MSAANRIIFFAQPVFGLLVSLGGLGSSAAKAGLPLLSQAGVIQIADLFGRLFIFLNILSAIKFRKQYPQDCSTSPYSHLSHLIYRAIARSISRLFQA